MSDMEKTENRVQVAVRMKPGALAEIERIARDEGRSKSDVIRRLLSEALVARAKNSR